MPPAESSPDPSPLTVAAIPARYGSTRLPAKPLRRIAGRPLIEHVYRRTAAAPGLDRVVVLTDDERIGAAVDGFGGAWEMTPSTCASGTDRIAWAAQRWNERAAGAGEGSVGTVINVQGDWILEPRLIGRLAGHLAGHPQDDMATLAVAAEAAELTDPSAVKVVCDRQGYALYFSRSEIPYRQQPGQRQPGEAPSLKHWGIYGYRSDTLIALSQLERSPLERSETLEQLRALENGIRIRVLVVEGRALGVDTPQDLIAAEEALRRDARPAQTGATDDRRAEE